MRTGDVDTPASGGERIAWVAGGLFVVCILGLMFAFLRAEERERGARVPAATLPANCPACPAPAAGAQLYITLTNRDGLIDITCRPQRPFGRREP